MDALEPTFLTVDEVLAIHADQVRLTRRWRPGPPRIRRGNAGGRLRRPVRSSRRLRDGGRLPVSFGANPPFVDGNKRVAAVAASVFLRFNGLDLTASSDDFYQMTLAVADGRADKAAAAEFFRTNTRRV